MAEEGHIAPGPRNKAGRTWLLVSLTPTAVLDTRTPALVRRENAIYDMIDSYSYAIKKPKWASALTRMRSDGRLVSPVSGVYVRPGGVPRMGCLLRGAGVGRYLKEGLLANLELFRQPHSRELAQTFQVDAQLVYNLVTQLRAKGIVQTSAESGEKEFTDYGKAMLAVERKFNPEPGVFTPYPDEDRA